MSKIYYKLGEVYGQPILVEIERDNKEAQKKAMVFEFVKSNGSPEWINSDEELTAQMFEETFNKFSLSEKVVNIAS